MRDVIGDVEDLEVDDEAMTRTSGDDGNDANKDEGLGTAEATGAAVAHVANEGLHEEARDWAVLLAHYGGGGGSVAASY